MHSRNQSAYSNSKKENADEIAPMEKRRKVAGGKMMAPTSTNLRTRSALSAVNAGPSPVENNDTSSVAASDAGSSIGTEFTSREDVEKLLAERMKGKFKTDFKGKNEQMVEYIKKLKICIKWLMEIEDGYILELGNLRSLSESEEKRHMEIETQLKNMVEELNSRIQDLEKECAILQEKLRMEETQKLALIKSCKEEVEARVASDNTCAALSEELKKTKEDLKRSSEQFKNLQETTKRLQEYNTSLQQYNSNLQADAAKNAEALSKLQTEKNAIMESISSMRDHNTLLKNQLESSKASQHEAVKVKEELQRDVASLKSELQHVREDRDKQSSHMQLLKAELDNYKGIIGETSEQLDTITANTNALEATCASQKKRIQVLELQLEAANESLKRADVTTTEAMAEYSEQKTMIQELQNRVAYAENQIFEGEKLRKKLHNTILELKGNIRVFCRVRPPLPDNDDEKEAAIVSYPTKYELLGRGIDLLHHDQRYSFTFDKVFDHKASQEDVFIEISQLVQSALDGYKVCIFAYGQTGSGKTYTMMGQPEASSKKGLIPRSLEQIFETSQSLQSLGWRYKMQASMLEIYNETIRDLLAPSRSNNQDSASQNKQHAIKHDPNGNTHVTDLTIVDVCSIKEVSFLLRQAAQSRSVGKTQMNEQSSRSHFVFTLRISGVNENTEQQVQGVLNLIDLAGSERIGKSGAVGERLKETQAINKSLSALSDVIFAIAKKEDHVPYRNSKLTYLLQPCLGGDSKTLMFVNISPEMSSSGESICSLRFAARVNSCEIGVPHRQTQMKSLESRLSCG